MRFNIFKRKAPAPPERLFHTEDGPPEPVLAGHGTAPREWAETCGSEDDVTLSFFEKVQQGFGLWLEDRNGSAPYRTAISFRGSRIFDLAYSLTLADGSDAEKAWCDDFSERTGFRGRFGTTSAIHAEIQGQALYVLAVTPIDDRQEVTLKLAPLVFLKEKNKIKYEQAYRTDPDGACFSIGVSGENVKLEQELYEFIDFSGTSAWNELQEVMETPPVMSPCIRYCEAMDLAQSRRRKVNELYAKQTLVTEHADVRDRNSFLTWLAEGVDTLSGKVKWALGKMLSLVSTGSGPAAYFLTVDPAGDVALANEILDNARQISAHSGVPIYKFGYPNEMSNRATAQVAEDYALFNQQRNAWEAGLLSIFRKAMRLNNSALGTALDPEKLLSVDMNSLPPDLAWAQQAILFEDWKAGAIDLETYLTQHPLIEDGQALAEKLMAEKAERAAAMMDQLGGGGNGGDDGDEEDDNDEEN